MGHPQSPPPPLVLLLHNAAVATSGDAYQFVEIDGTRYSHIVDPKTGVGLTNPSSVTVVAADGITADSLASAVSVLGPARGIAFINRRCNGTAAFVSQDLDGTIQTAQSQRFRCYVAPQE